MKLKLVKKVNEAKGTKTFFWKPEAKVDFLPGQYYYFTLPKLDYPDPRGATRHFTISASPTEGDLLRLTTRIRDESGYKKTLDALPIDSVIDGEGPTGTFILDEKEKNKTHIFLAGGIGITPFRVFIKYNIDKNLQIPMYLLTSNSNEDEVAYKKELADWEKKYKFFKMKSIITSKEGRMDEEKIMAFIKENGLDINNLTFWVVGPPLFVSALEDVLEKMDIASDRILTEKFTGY